jgi:hypothetical protein
MAWLVILIYTLFVVNSSVNATQFECSDAMEVFVRRSLGRTDYGQVTLQTHQEASDIKTCWLSMAYCNRGLEWIHPTSLLRDAVTLVTGGVDMFDCKLSYSTTPSVSDMLYKPRAVFTDFSVTALLASGNDLCSCQQFGNILDPRTAAEFRLPGDNCLHARTIKVREVLRNKWLRDTVNAGLNHVPLQPTVYPPIREALSGVWNQFEEFLVHRSGLMPDYALWQSARRTFFAAAYERFQTGLHTNHGGHKSLTPVVWEMNAVKREIDNLLEVLYVSGVDKAATTVMFRCIKHERLQALKRLSGTDFIPCMDGSQFAPPDNVLQSVLSEWTTLVPEAPVVEERFPYIFSLYKEHKGTHRWLTNGHGCVFSPAATLLQKCTELALKAMEEHAGNRARFLRGFHHTRTSVFPPVRSMYDVLLNLPETIHTIYCADITKCYEAIPVDDSPNSLQTVVRWLFKTTFAHIRTTSGTVPVMWVKWDRTAGIPLTVRWGSASKMPQSKLHTWFCMDLERLCAAICWLMSHAYTILGDRVWLQALGIPMGFSCSPVWCIVYLLYYEWHFVSRLMRLGMHSVLPKFRYWFRYIDDLLLVNGLHPRWFFNPRMPQTADSPYWIYPLHILVMSPEVVEWSKDPIGRSIGTKVHFLNFTIAVHAPGTPGGYTLHRFVKRKTLPFPTVLYLQCASNRPVSAVYGVAKSQLLPFMYVNSTALGAQNDLIELISTLVANGCSAWRLIRELQSMLIPCHFPGLGFDVTDIVLTWQA